MSFLQSRPGSAREGVGRPILRKEDARLLVGGGCYSDDVNLPGQAYACFVRSPHAHARVGRVETAAARATPGVIATGTFTFILAWNDYIFARVLLSADELKTLPVGIADLYNASVVDWGMIMAAGLLVIAPVVVVFVFIQKYLVAGWGAGGVKG